MLVTGADLFAEFDPEGSDLCVLQDVVRHLQIAFEHGIGVIARITQGPSRPREVIEFPLLLGLADLILDNFAPVDHRIPRSVRFGYSGVAFVRVPEAEEIAFPVTISKMRTRAT